MSYKIKRFSSLTKETKTQKENRKNLSTSIGGLTALTGAVGAAAYDDRKTTKEMNRVKDMYKKARENDESIYNNTDRKIKETADKLKSKSKGIGDDLRINRGKFKAEMQNISNDSHRFHSSFRARLRGENLINKASNKRLAIGLGLSAAAGLGAAYGINKMAKNRNIRVNESKKNK